jgi:hypothetical protein
MVSEMVSEISPTPDFGQDGLAFSDEVVSVADGVKPYPHIQSVRRGIVEIGM